VLWEVFRHIGFLVQCAAATILAIAASISNEMLLSGCSIGNGLVEQAVAAYRIRAPLSVTRHKNFAVVCIH
jgi:hypothetical protein